jgi:Skp family chaperone for outer membrane proteins
VSATAIASIRNVLFSLRFPVALEEEEEEEENPTSDDETFLFEEEEAEEEDIEIREEKELKNVIDEVDATVKTLILRAHVSKFN